MDGTATSTAPAIDTDCPILKDMMIDPVVAEDGFTYERGAIQDWLSQKPNQISPMTGLPIGKKVIPNLLVRQYIDSLGKVSDEQKSKRVKLVPMVADDSEEETDSDVASLASRDFDESDDGPGPVHRVEFVRGHMLQPLSPLSPRTPQNQRIQQLGFSARSNVPNAPMRFRRIENVVPYLGL